MNPNNTNIPDAEIFERAILLYAVTAEYEGRPLPPHVIERPHYAGALASLTQRSLIERTDQGYLITQRGMAYWHAIAHEHTQRYNVRYAAAVRVLHDYNPDGTRKQTSTHFDTAEEHA